MHACVGVWPPGAMGKGGGAVGSGAPTVPGRVDSRGWTAELSCY